MKAITNFALTALCASAMVSTAFAETPEGWETEVEVAIEMAKEQNKAVMLEFTGSDWCAPCKMMTKNVFSKEEFVTAASEKFVLVHLDFPKGDPELAEKNTPYAEEYKIEGYPTVILLDSDGKEFNRFPASVYPDVDQFLAHLDQALENKDLD